MNFELLIKHARHRGCTLAALALLGGTSAAIAQTPPSPMDKAATHAPAAMAAQPTPMQNKDSSMNVTPGMSAGSVEMRGSMMGMMKNMESTKSTGDTDRDFATMMKIHHQGAIDMAQQEMQSGKDAKLKTMAKRIINAQQKEIKQFDQWLDKHK